MTLVNVNDTQGVLNEHLMVMHIIQRRVFVQNTAFLNGLIILNLVNIGGDLCLVYFL